MKKIEEFLKSINKQASSWYTDSKVIVIPVSKRTIYYWKNKGQISKNMMRLLQSLPKIRFCFIPVEGNYKKGERWHPKEILIRLEKFKQKVGTWNEVAVQLGMPRESLIRCNSTGRMSRTTGLLLDGLLTQKGFSVVLQYLPVKTP